MHTNATAEAFIIDCIEATDVSTRDEYNIEAIASELFDLAGSWDVEQIETDAFWEIVAKHEN